MDHKTYATKVVLDNGPWVGRDNPVNQATGDIAGVPDRIWGADGFVWVVTYYEDAADTTGVDMSGGTAKLYIALDTALAAAYEIGTGVVSGANDNIVTYTVVDSAIPYAYWGNNCILIAEVETGNYRTTICQRVIPDHNLAGSGTAPTAPTMGYTPAVTGDWPGTDPDDVAEALDDLAERQTDTNLYGHIYVSAKEMTSRTTNGAAFAEREYATNDIMLAIMGFDPGTEEAATFQKRMPADWDLGTIKARVDWTNAGGGAAEVARFSLAARAYVDDDAIDQAQGTAQVVDDTWIAQGDLHQTDATPAITVAGTPAAGKLVIFELRVVAASTTITGDVDVAGVEIQYGKSFTAPTAW